LAGGTEVIAGVRLEVGDVSPGEVEGLARRGKEEWRTRVEVDV
jgi:hypothetical protein